MFNKEIKLINSPLETYIRLKLTHQQRNLVSLLETYIRLNCNICENAFEQRNCSCYKFDYETAFIFCLTVTLARTHLNREIAEYVFRQQFLCQNAFSQMLQLSQFQHVLLEFIGKSVGLCFQLSIQQDYFILRTR